jgi:hypothetical protein
VRLRNKEEEPLGEKEIPDPRELLPLGWGGQIGFVE